MLSSTLAAALVLTLCAPPSPYSRWKNGPAASDDFFPIAVWLQAPRNAGRYREIGINLYVGLWRGPTEEQLAELERHGMRVICSQNEFARAHLERKIIAGWMHGDEPDNAQALRGGKGYGPPVPPEKVVADYDRIRASDPTRPVFLNLGQGVAWDAWHGRGERTNHPEDYARYARGSDIVSFDIYPAVHDRPEVSGKLWYVPRGVKRLREWAGPERPVWNCIECTRIGNRDRKPTPAEVRAEVWMSIIHGSRGIVYFCHQFEPRFIEAALLEDAEMREAVAAINGEIRRLAPVINGPTLEDGTRVEVDPPDVSAELERALGPQPIATLVKKRDGSVYVFAARMEGSPARATFALEGLRGKATVEVLGEGRAIEADAGRFTDSFEGHAVHLYRIDAEEPERAEARESFDADPGWDGFRNRLLPERLPVVRQDFGHRSTNLAGGRAPGEIGGAVQRSTTRAWFAKPIPARTMDEPLSVSGKLAVTRAEASSGILVGWFHESSRGWRTTSSMAMRLDGNGGKFWIFYEYGTRRGLTGGAGAFEGDRYQTTPTEPFRADGKVHDWSLAYTPGADGKDGVLAFRIDDRKYEIPVSAEHRRDGAAFDRFGIWNVEIGGESMEAYFDDLVIDGRPEGCDTAEGWTGEGHRASFEDRVIRPRHDYGFSPTSHAGGAPGEIGGIIFRDERPSYHAADVERLTLEEPLRASGRIVLRSAGADSAMCLGWFDGGAKRAKETSELAAPQPGWLGVVIEGPSRVGHYFRAAYADAAGSGQAPCEDPRTGAERPVIRPDGRQHRWAIEYDPGAAGGSGRITVKLDDAAHTLDLRAEDRARGAAFDRFGVFNLQAGGHHVEFYLDDLGYTSGRADRRAR